MGNATVRKEIQQMTKKSTKEKDAIDQILDQLDLHGMTQEELFGKGCHRPDTRPAGPAWNDAGGAVWGRRACEEAHSPAAEQGA